MGWIARLAVAAAAGAALILMAGGTSAQPQAPKLAFAAAAAPANGPWRFRTGDDPHWADPTLDDSAWERVDLTPKPGARDDDVGLTNYVPGWAARGHKGYAGFAWYRLSVRAADPGAGGLWLAGPAAVDNAYQVYLNGHLIGGIGDFGQSPPAIVSIQPRLYALPRGLWTVRDGELQGVIALRVVAEKGAGVAPDGGGVRIAPWLGTEAGAAAHVRDEWLQTLEGYVVDAVEPLAFLLLAALALALRPFDRTDRFPGWIAAALVLLAAQRGNQVLFFFTHLETLRDFALWRVWVIDGLLLGAWLAAWMAAFRVEARRARWVCAGLTLAFLVLKPLTVSLLLPGLPHAVSAMAATAVKTVRWGFLAALAVVLILGLRRNARTGWLAALAAVAGSIGVFAGEVGQLGVPGIWFPFGVGVSRSQYAYVVFAVLLAAELLRRLWAFAPRRQPA